MPPESRRWLSTQKNVSLIVSNLRAEPSSVVRQHAGLGRGEAPSPDPVYSQVLLLKPRLVAFSETARFV